MVENSNNKFTRVLLIVAVALVLFTCVSRKRTGAVCEDGWESSAKGSGACSSHGGVDHWTYKYWWE